jgi:hypothetical protein
MKRTITTFIIVLSVMIACSAYVLQSNGMPGYAGSPGEQTCNACHGGGNSPSSGTTITAVPSFTNNEYYPDSTYHITISVAATNFNRFGFACEILDSLLGNAGTMSNNGSGVKFQNAFNGRRNAVHTTAKIGTPSGFTFDWKAPASGQANFFVAANAVNGNGNTNFDFPMAPVSMSLVPGTPPTPTVTPEPEDSTKDVGIREHSLVQNIDAFVHPNPAAAYTNLSYSLLKSEIVNVSLQSLDGKEIKQFHSSRRNAGYNSQILDLTSVTPGVYFVRVKVGEHAVSQKLISVH